MLIGLQAVVRGWAVAGSDYFQDDFAHLDLARSGGLSSAYLVRDYGGHVEVGQYFLLWLMSHAIDGTFAPAALVIVSMQVTASVLLFVCFAPFSATRPSFSSASPLTLQPVRGGVVELAWLLH